MSQIDYATFASGEMSNTVKLGTAPVDYDYQTDAQEGETYINGGRYVYTGEVNGLGMVASSNPYLYDDATFELDRDWTQFRDPDQYQYASDKCILSACN